MNLVFSGSSSTEIEFKVNIAGTASAPQKVTAVLEQNGVALSFQAKNNGDMWTATICNMGGVLQPGLANFYINVILNDKVFVPLKSSATIENAQQAPNPEVTITNQQVSPVSNPVPTVEANETAITELPSEIPKVETETKTESVEAESENIPAIPEAPVQPISNFSLLRSIEPARKKPSKVTEQIKVTAKPVVTNFTLVRKKVVTE